MIVAILACDEKFGIGKDGGIPWHFKEDFKHFKEVTSGKKIVMGRKTWDSLPKKPLPNRVNIVITRNKEFEADGAIVSDDIVWPDDGEDLCVIGGSEIYKLYAPYIDKVVMTRIPGDYKCDTFVDFPSLNLITAGDDIKQLSGGLVVETFYPQEEIKC